MVLEFDPESPEEDLTVQELDLPAGVSGMVIQPCQHGKWMNCLPCDVYNLKLRIYDLEDKVRKLQCQNKKIKKFLKVLKKLLK